GPRTAAPARAARGARRRGGLRRGSGGCRRGWRRDDDVHAGVPAAGDVRDALDGRAGQDLAQEAELRRACMPVAARDGEDRAVVLGDAEAAVVAALEVREVAGFVQDPRELLDTAREVAASQAALGVEHARLAAALEDASEQRGVLVLDVGEQLGAQL